MPEVHSATFPMDVDGSSSDEARISAPVGPAIGGMLLADMTATRLEVRATVRIGHGPDTTVHANSEHTDKFRRLADGWRRETAHLSNIKRAFLHPSYQSIIGMGEAAVPLLLRELERAPGHWLWALNAITEEDPSPGGANLEQASSAWIQWGRARGYI